MRRWLRLRGKLKGYGEHALAELWPCFLATAHLAAGLAVALPRRVPQDVVLLMLVIGVVLDGIANSLILSSLVGAAIGYTAASVRFALL